MVRIVRAEGSAVERGVAIGRALGDEIARSLSFYRDYLGERGLRDLERAVAPYRAAARALSTEATLLDGMATGAEVAPAELWAVNALEELESQPIERCSTFTAVAPGTTLLAHNEQWLAGDAANVAVVVEVDPDGAWLASPTVAACLPAVGLTSAGLAQGIDSLTAPDDRVGIPRVLVSRHALAAHGAADAIRRATVPGRAGGYAHVLALRGGRTLTVETTADAHAVLPGPGPHANHCLAAPGDEPSAGSRARQERLERLLAERAPATPEHAMALLADHDSVPQAICEHGVEGDDEASVVLFSMVCELESGRMWVAPGNPCETPYEEVDLSDLATVD